MEEKFRIEKYHGDCVADVSCPVCFTLNRKVTLADLYSGKVICVWCTHQSPVQDLILTKMRIEKVLTPEEARATVVLPPLENDDEELYLTPKVESRVQTLVTKDLLLTMLEDYINRE